MRNEPQGGWYYEQIALGFNYRMTDIHAALGLSQLRRIEAFVNRRRALAARYDDRLAALPLGVQAQSNFARSAYHLYIIRVEAARRRATYDALRADGIGVNLHYIPVYLQPYYRDLGFEPGLCPLAESYYAQSITIPLYAAMSEAQQDEVIGALSRAVAA
jgi:dTDP-4-amino-4,6-dideoxygalactose transaminase